MLAYHRSGVWQRWNGWISLKYENIWLKNREQQRGGYDVMNEYETTCRVEASNKMTILFWRNSKCELTHTALYSVHKVSCCGRQQIILPLLNVLNKQSTQKSELIFFPLTCYKLLPSFGDTGQRDVRLLSNIMEWDGTVLVALKSQNKCQQQCLLEKSCPFTQGPQTLLWLASCQKYFVLVLMYIMDKRLSS